MSHPVDVAAQELLCLECFSELLQVAKSPETPRRAGQKASSSRSEEDNNEEDGAAPSALAKPAGDL